MFKLSYAVLFSLALTAIASPLAPRSCSDVTVYFARGTGESGTIGTTVGPQFKAALKTALGSKTLEFVGVPYPANIWGFLEGGDPGGSTTMANYVKAKASSCPSTKIVLSGYR
jgi:cutinase